MSYSLRTTERESLTRWIDRALDSDPPLSSLCIDRKVGRSASQQGEIQSEELAILASQGGASAIIDEIVERYACHGGRWQIRQMIDVGEGEPKKQLKRSFDMVRARAPERSGSKGSAAGVEELTKAFADGFAAQIESQQSAQAAQNHALQMLLEKQTDWSLIRLQESTAYQAQIDNLRSELLEARLELAVSSQSSVLTPEILAQLLPGVVSLLQAGAARLLSTEGSGPASVPPAS
jgi:hypothetical protein|tara:strand:- start:604 stop:1308 length:705 start_codon:yes stop_codon:yes gene_type:complete